MHRHGNSARNHVPLIGGVGTNALVTILNYLPYVNLPRISAPYPGRGTNSKRHHYTSYQQTASAIFTIRAIRRQRGGRFSLRISRTEYLWLRSWYGAFFYGSSSSAA